MPSRTEILRTFFSVPEKPVTPKELLDFARSDRAGYDQLADEVAAATNQVVETPKK